jgi:acyl-CoA synthetase (NDP forming)
MSRLDRLLRPRHIAVLGAGWALNVIEQCRKMGFKGQVWPVHPTKAEIGGLEAYASLADLPEAPDATFVGVNRFATIDVVAELAAMGAGGAICFASGWTEAGEPGLQDKLVAAAGDMPILGPNCYGVINYLDGALLWPDQHGGVPVESGVALVSQSSNIVINLGMQQRGRPVAYVAGLGNAAVVGLAELTGALLDDPRVTAVGLYIEGIDDAPAFAALAEKARAMGKGVVAIKSGKTELSRTAAASHTASLAGGGAASSAFLRQIGVAEVNTPSELVETLKIFHVHGPQVGTRLCSLSCSGGEAGLVADLAAPYGIDFPPVPKATLPCWGRFPRSPTRWTITPSSGATGRRRPRSSPPCSRPMTRASTSSTRPAPTAVIPRAMIRPSGPLSRRRRPPARLRCPLPRWPRTSARGGCRR